MFCDYDPCTVGIPSTCAGVMMAPPHEKTALLSPLQLEVEVTSPLVYKLSYKKQKTKTKIMKNKNIGKCVCFLFVKVICPLLCI